MNLDLLWEHERRKATEESPKEEKPKLNKQISSTAIVHGKCIPLLTADEKIFEKSGFALDYEGHMIKRMNPPPSMPGATTAAPSPTPLHISPCTNEMTKKRRSTIVLKKREPTPIKVHEKLSITSLLKTAPPRKSEHEAVTDIHVSSLEDNAFKKYAGDYFSTRGEYVDGMLYMSRMKKSHVILHGHQTPLAQPSQTIDGIKLKETLSLSMDGDGELNQVAGTQAQRCAATLANWSSNRANAKLMMEEGVIEAVMQLCMNEDTLTRIHCMSTFMNLSNIPELRRGIIVRGAVKTIGDVLSGCDDKALQIAGALTLCNLCCLQGEEARLVADGAISAIGILINESNEVAAISERALFNLTCVSEPFVQIDLVMKALISLASSGHSKERTLYICAMAFANLSNIKRVRSRLLEEGIIAALSALLRSQNVEVKHLVANVICNIASMRNTRAELMTKGALGVLVALAPHPSLTPAAHLLIGSVLCHLSKETSIRQRLVLEGLLTIVTAITHAHGGGHSFAIDAPDDVRKVCATAIHNCSCSDETRLKLVERDGVAILTALSSGASADVRRMCTLALCNFLMVKQAAMEIVSCGAVTSLFELAKQSDSPPSSQLIYATAFYNLCQNPISREAIGSGGGVDAIVSLSSYNLTPSASNVSVGILTLCAASLCFLAADDNTRHFVANSQVVGCITKLLESRQKDPCVPIQKFGSACLSMLSQTESCSMTILSQGGIHAVLNTCATCRDSETKACCCDLLASLSFHSTCRSDLVSLGVLPTLKMLAKIRDPDIQRRCATTIGNLTSEQSVHGALLDANIVSVLGVLSNSYSEESQSDCAKALCNLSCTHGYEEKLVAEGAVGVLLMIAAVRSGSAITKETCARALGNLLLPDTMDTMLQEGLVKLLPALTKLDAALPSPIPAALFAKLVRSEKAREALCAETQTLRTLFFYMQQEGHSPDTVDLLSSVACDLMVFPNTRTKAVQDGLLTSISALAQRSTNERFVSVLLLMATNADTRFEVLRPEAIGTLLSYLDQSPSLNVAWMAVAALCHLSWDTSTRERLDELKVSAALVRLLQPDFVSVLQVTLLALTCLSFRVDHVTIMLQEGLCPALLNVISTNSSLDYRKLICLVFRQATRAPIFLEQIQNRETRQPIFALLCTLCLTRDLLDENAALDCADILCTLASIDGLSSKLVVEEIVTSIQVLLSFESNETQWRCAAALHAMSSDASSRKALADLGATPLLIRMAYSKAAFDTLYCCTMALCQLSNEPRNATVMVQHDAVPAFLHLSKLEHEQTREACSLALANLSNETPQVSTGSVLALIHLSLHEKNAISSRTPSSIQTTRRPSPVTSPHHETTFSPPLYDYCQLDYTELFGQKQAADLPCRQPPIPHLPSITVDPESIHSSIETPTVTSLGPEIDELSSSAQASFPKMEPMDAASHLNLSGVILESNMEDGIEENELASVVEDLPLADSATEEEQFPIERNRGVHSYQHQHFAEGKRSASTKGLLRKRSSVAMLCANAPGSFRTKKKQNDPESLLRMSSMKRSSRAVLLSTSASLDALPSTSSKKRVSIAPQEVNINRQDSLRQQAKKMGLWS